MSERDGYIHGVPCWIDTSQPDPEAALPFYGGLFGWEFEDVMPKGADGSYFICRIRGGDVAAARRGYERAWGNDGSAVAAFGLARSYDPLVLLTLPATNATPDKSQAMQWYQRAAAAGHADAGSAIALLQMN